MMNHFTTEEWIDYANEVLAEPKKVQLRKHLDDGCRSCLRMAAMWGGVRQALTREASYQPPADTLRVVKASFVTSGLVAKGKKIRGGVRLLFDSFLQPGLAGLRSADMSARQMLYRADPYQLDLEIEATPGTNRLVVTGQLLVRTAQVEQLPGHDRAVARPEPSGRRWTRRPGDDVESARQDHSRRHQSIRRIPRRDRKQRRPGAVLPGSQGQASPHLAPRCAGQAPWRSTMKKASPGRRRRISFLVRKYQELVVRLSGWRYILVPLVHSVWFRR